VTSVFISGRLGRALYACDGAYYTHDVGLPPAPSTPSEMGALGSSRADFEFVEIPPGASIEGRLVRCRVDK
jgi:hypothetical protein